LLVTYVGLLFCFKRKSVFDVYFEFENF